MNNNNSLLRTCLRTLCHQNWLRFGIRDRIIRFFHNPDTAKNETFNVPFYGRNYPGNFSTYIDWMTFYYGAYADQELYLMKDAIKDSKDPIILDIGANVGHHSLFASTIAKEVHAFEPYSAVCMKIQEKISANAINNIIIHTFGLGELDAELPFFPPIGGNSGVGSFLPPESSDCTPSIILQIRNGDNFLSKLNLPSIAYIKMDIEGFELYALKGLKNTIKKHRPVIFFEWTANSRGTKADIKDIFPDNYLVYHFTSDRPYFGIFNKPEYELTKVSNLNHDGNYLSIPEEKLSLLSFKNIKG